MKNFLIAILLCCLFPFVQLSASDLVDVSPVTNKILLVHFDDGHIDYFGYHQTWNENIVYYSPLDTIAATVLTNYQIISTDDTHYTTAQNPMAAGRKSKGMDFNRLQWGDPNIIEYVREHWVYIELPTAMERGKSYTLTLNNLAANRNSFTFVYNETALRSEAVHVSQLGYVPDRPKYGYLSQWMGDFNTTTHPDGGLELDNLAGADFYIVPADNRSITSAVFIGTIQKRTDKTDAESSHADFGTYKNYSYADVWECDFSALTTEGEYVLVVEGMGCSYPFEISADVYREAYYATARGLFYQRQGVAKEIKPGLVWPRDHHPDDLLHYYDAAKIGGTHIARGGTPEAGKPRVYGIWGYYHDAGDWDRYDKHDQIPMILLMLYDLKPENFADGDVGNRYKLANDDPQYIDEGANGIPDILDEARWLIEWGKRGRHALKDQGLGTGGVPGEYTGREGCNGGHPSWEDLSAAWCVSAEAPTPTYNYAGCAAWYATLLKELGKPAADYQPWLDDAIDAYNWAVAKGGGTNDSKAFASVCLYRATGNTTYQTTFKSVYSGGASCISTPLTWEHTAGIYAMLPADFPGLDVTFQQGTVRNNILTAANNAVNPAQNRGFRLAVPQGRRFNLGSHNTPRTEIIAIAYHVTGDEKYLNAIHTSAAYCLGGNEMNTCHVTQLGERSEKFAFQHDAWFTLDYNSKVYTNPIVEGFISYFGNTEAWVNGGVGSEFWSHKSLYPSGIANWPKGEGRIYNRESIAGSEFTVHQSNVQAIFSYGYLCDESAGDYEKNARPTVSLSYPADNAQFATGSDIALKVNVSEDTRMVSYYFEEHLIGTTTTAPFSLIWNDAPAGTYKITAVAFDDKGAISEPSEDGDITLGVSASANVPASGATFENCPSAALPLFTSMELLPEIAPLNATNKAVTWTSGNPTKVSVSPDGEIFAADYGTVVITATTADGGLQATCTLSVEPPVEVTGVNFTDCNNSTLGTASTLMLAYEVLPADATNKKVSWLSDDTGIAKVTANGVISGITAGNTDITIKTNDGEFTDVCNVTVVESNYAPEINPVGDMVLLKNSGAQQITLSGISDGNSTAQTLSISATSDRTEVIPNPTVDYTQGSNTATLNFTPQTDATGIVNIKITLTDNGGTEYNGSDKTEISFRISVVHSLTMSIPGLIQAEDFTSTVGEVQTDVSGDTDGSDYVGWFNQNEELRYAVDEVTAGVYKVTFRLANGSGNAGQIVLRSGSETLCQKAVVPTGGWLTWSSVADTVILDAGEQTIAIVQAGAQSFNINWIEFTATDIPCCVSGVTIENCPTTQLLPGSTVALDESVSPANVFNPAVEWSSSDNSLATVDEQGGITAIAPGNPVITVETLDGGFQAQCALQIIDNNYITSLSATQKPAIFPNPAGDILYVSNIEAVSTIAILDVCGRNVQQYSLSGSSRLMLDISSLRPGSYILKFTRGDGSTHCLNAIKQ